MKAYYTKDSDGLYTVHNPKEKTSKWYYTEREAINAVKKINGK